MRRAQKFLGAGFFMATLAHAAPEASLDAALDRFERAQAQSQVEDIWAHQRRLVQTRFVSSGERRRAEDSMVKVEWYLRLGPARSPLTLDDLKNVRDPELLDEVLWSLLNEAVLGDIFLRSNDWDGIRTSIAAFLLAHPQHRALLESEHGAWWAWIQDFPSKKSEQPWELMTLKQVLVARAIPDPLAALQQYCLASGEVPEEQSAAGLSLAQEVRASLPEDPTKQRQLLREIFVRKVPCRRLYGDLAEVYEGRQNFDLASEQRSYSLLQKLDSGESLSALELRDVGRYLFEAREWAKAFEFYSRALQEGAQDLDVRVREVVSGIRAENVKFEDTAQASLALEEVLRESFQSIYRDEVLRTYALFLESRKDMEAAIEVWRWNYQYAARKAQRIEGLEKSVVLAGDWLNQGKTGSARKAEAMRWLDEISTLRRLNPSSDVIRKQVSISETRIKRLELLGEADIRASLDQAQRGSKP